MKTKIIIGVVIALILPIICIGMIISEVQSTGTLSSRGIIMSAVILLSEISFCIKYFGPIVKMKGRSAPKNYEEIYRDIISDAFVSDDQKKDRAQLIDAIRLYNQDKFNSSLLKLSALMPKCTNDKEKYAVMIFTALNFTDGGATDSAIDVYKNILEFRNDSSTVYSNLGILYNSKGDLKNALDSYKKAVECDPDNPYAYNNIASVFLRNAEYDKAIPFAIKALELKSNLTAASNSLAICYSVLGDKELADKYFKISVTNGVNAEKLSRTIKNIVENGPDL